VGPLNTSKGFIGLKPFFVFVICIQFTYKGVFITQNATMSQIEKIVLILGGWTALIIAFTSFLANNIINRLKIQLNNEE